MYYTVYLQNTIFNDCSTRNSFTNPKTTLNQWIGEVRSWIASISCDQYAINGRWFYDIAISLLVNISAPKQGLLRNYHFFLCCCYSASNLKLAYANLIFIIYIASPVTNWMWINNEKKNEEKLIIGYIISCYRFDRRVTVSGNVWKTWAPVKGNLTKIKLLSASDCIFCKRSHGEEFFSCWFQND